MKKRNMETRESPMISGLRKYQKENIYLPQETLLQKTNLFLPSEPGLFHRSRRGRTIQRLTRTCHIGRHSISVVIKEKNLWFIKPDNWKTTLTSLSPAGNSLISLFRAIFSIMSKKNKVAPQ